MMELLAPAGGREQLEAAIRFGADAVYLAANKFGMRARAANFAMEEIPSAVAYAHEQGVKVHVTCNILMHQNDIAELPEYFKALQDAGVDAFIISDLGAAALARKYAPDVDLHVSTQASVANAEAAKVWYNLGARRIVCAREMSLDQIAALKREIPEDLEIEVFVHGAMCMAVSGRCLISSYLTGRSGNKGHCTQPCRWHYTLEEDKRPGQHFPIEEDDNGTYIMNAKDLNMIEHLAELEAIGVDSIKIEGRNKKAFYVASVVNAYRNVLDGADSAIFAKELLDVSHRPYNTGFYFGPAQQADDYDGYEQETLHVGDIWACEACWADEGTAQACIRSAQITAMCRNRFAEGDTLEVLQPYTAPFEVTIHNLEWLGVVGENGLRPAPVAVPVANRAEGEYRFTCELPNNTTIEPGSFLRMRIFRRSARSGQE